MLLTSVFLPLCAVRNDSTGQVRIALVLDTDAGTDDATCMMMLKYFGVYPNYIIATGGNDSVEDVIRNAVVLNKYIDGSVEVFSGKAFQLIDKKIHSIAPMVWRAWVKR